MVLLAFSTSASVITQGNPARPNLFAAAALFAVLLLPFKFLRDEFPYIDVANYLILGIALIYALNQYITRRSIFCPRIHIAAFIVIILGYLFGRGGLAEAGATELPIRTFVFIVVNMFITPVLLMNLFQTNRNMNRQLVSFFIAGNLLGAAVALFHYHNLTPAFLSPFLRSDAGGREGGMSAGVVFLGATMALTLPFCISFALAERRLLRRMLWILSGAGLLYVSNLTGSRSSLVLCGLGLATVVALFTLAGRLQIFKATAITVTFALVLLYLGSVGEESSAIARLLADSLSGRRSNLIRDAMNVERMEIFLAHPLFGNGYNAYMSHNALAAVLATSGIVGVTGLLMRELPVIRAVGTLLRSIKSLGDDIPLAIGLITSYSIWLLYLYSDFWLYFAHGYVIQAALIIMWAQRLPPQSQS